MAESQAGWSKYQEEVSRYLDSLGFETKINERLVGQLTSHDIDVAARYCKAGLSVLWVVECKFWNRRVPKEKVGALKTIVADDGADRGLLVSQLGFQSGANAFAKNTNITLTTLEQLRTFSVDELREIRTRAIADSAWDLIDRLDTLKILTPIDTRPPIRVVDYPEGVDSRLVQGLNAWLYAQRESLKDAKRSRLPFPYVNFYGDQQLVVYMRNADEFLQFIEPALAQVQAEVENLELTACASASRVK